MPAEPSFIPWIALFAAFWLALAVIGQVAEWPAGKDGKGLSPRPDLSTGLAALLLWVYLRIMHRMEVEGRQNLAMAVEALRGDEGAGGGGGRKPRGLVVTANHAAGIDPLLLQAAVGGSFFIRWLAAADTVSPTIQPFVEFADVIFVNSNGDGGNELVGVRAAIKYLQGEPGHPLTHGRPGVLGLFPEGRIARRPGVITPFQPGIGLMIARSKALVLPVVLKGVPIRDNTYRSFFVPSRSRVIFMPPVDYAAMGVKAGAIPAELQGRYEQWVGPVVAAKGITRK